VTNTEIHWLTIPDLAQILGIGVSKVRRLIEDRSLLAVRVEEVLKVPDVFLRDAQPLPELRGTLIVLADSGFSDEEAMHWLLEDEDNLGAAPIDALRGGRKAEVRRVAQALAI
jgi:excisionase family DNA binding protein